MSGLPQAHASTSNFRGSQTATQYRIDRRADNDLNTTFQDFRHVLDRIENESFENAPTQSVFLANLGVDLGKFIDDHIPRVLNEAEWEATRRKYWDYVATFWPVTYMTGELLKERYESLKIITDNEAETGVTVPAEGHDATFSSLESTPGEVSSGRNGEHIGNGGDSDGTLGSEAMSISLGPDPEELRERKEVGHLCRGQLESPGKDNL